MSVVYCIRNKKKYLHVAHKLKFKITCFDSPFQMKVKPAVEPKNVKLSGPGVQNKVPASLPVEFTIDTREAGKAEPVVDIKVH